MRGVVSEAQLLRSVLYRARKWGWSYARATKVLTPHGLVTPMSRGWPDLILARPGRLLAVELKSNRGSLRPEQRRWLDILQAAGVETYVWRPRDLASGAIDAVLRED